LGPKGYRELSLEPESESRDAIRIIAAITDPGRTAWVFFPERNANRAAKDAFTRVSDAVTRCDRKVIMGAVVESHV